MRVLLCITLLALVSGCIPIGVRGSSLYTWAATEVRRDSASLRGSGQPAASAGIARTESTPSIAASAAITASSTGLSTSTSV